jgi:GAF domain-containing protein/anti-sigma regulatory factor (Ser/Thr protein kinase)
MPSETSTISADQPVEELRRELAEAREQQAATAEILRVISSAPMDSQRVFAEIAASAGRLCDASDAAIHQVDGEVLRLVASHGSIPKGDDTLPLTREVVTGRAVLDRQTIQVADVQAETSEYPVGSANARRLGHRTLLAVPLMRSGQAIGVIGIRRTEVRPFSHRQIELLKTFADQAVIAVENTRLFEAEQERTRELQERTNELTDALEYQTATSGVLSVISSSPTNIQPVYDKIAIDALKLCGATWSSVLRFDGELIRIASLHNLTDARGLEAIRSAFPRAPRPGGTNDQAVLTGTIAYIPDVLEDSEYKFQDLAQVTGYRSHLSVPMLQDGRPVGAITVAGASPGAFSSRQIALLQTFADQAVIAIENTRLFEEVQARTKELQESLEYQTATSEVLGVIGRSPSDVQPVLDAIVQTAVRLCDAEYAIVYKLDDGRYHPVATNNVEDELVKYAYAHSLAPGRGSLVGRTALERRTVHLPDCLADPEYDHLEYQRIGKYRSTLGVPLLRQGVPIGVVVLMRAVVKPFTDKQIELVTTFADQAVIAIENTRLFEEVQTRTRELTESLEQQMATSNVLSAISCSPGDLEPVFAAMLQNAVRICDAKFGTLSLYDGDAYQNVTLHNVPTGLVEARLRESFRPHPKSSMARVAATKETSHIHDLRATPAYIEGDSAVRAMAGAGARTILNVPMLKEDRLVGAISIFRQDVRPFTDKQIELVSNFATQAVIAIENTRLLTELRESLQQQTATGDVLKVISRSAFDLKTVLDTLVESAARLCRADKANIARISGEAFQFISFFGFEPEYREYLLSLQRSIADRGSITGRTVVEGRTVHIADVMADPEFTWFEAQKRGGFRTGLGVPLMREGTPIGVFFLAREKVEPFTKQEIDLVTTFADQAVIAIENTRLFEAEQASKRELQDSLEYQTATSEVLAAISRSPTNVQPVFDTIASSAAKLCNALDAIVLRVDRDTLRIVAHHGYMPTDDVPIHRGTLSGRTVIERRLIHVTDLQTEDVEFPAGSAFARRFGHRTTLSIPLLCEGEAIGNIQIRRAQVRPFTAKQIALVQTFADQAVIAIENARLFEAEQASKRELTESLEYQTATSEVLGVISSSPNELQPVLDSIVATANSLCAANYAIVFIRDDDGMYSARASSNADPAFIEWVRNNPIAYDRGSVVGRVALTKRTVHLPDCLADAEFTRHAHQQHGKFRSMVGVPLIRSGEAVGVIFLARTEVRPFTERQIDLVTTFADQAVIAINNVGLFEEVQARNRDLTALGEVGRAVSSTLDLKVVLKTIVERAVDLSSTEAGSIFYYRAKVGRFELGETVGIDEETIARLSKLDIAAKHSGLGEAIAQRKPLLIPDLTRRESNPLRVAAIEAGFRSALIVPLLSSDGALGTLVLQRRQPGEFNPSVVSLMQSFADQSAIALENARLFAEIAQKSRELEIASQHKSQFVANMSHELRTPLAAILGYAELIQEGFYEPQGPKSLDALTRIRSNGKHLLGLINTVLDIAKIESGQFTLNMAEYALESVVETVRSATESLAQNKKLALKTEVAKSLPIGLGDEQRLTQVLLNLVGNAIKFTDTGEVRVTAKAVNGHFNVSVTDTGPGIPEEHQARIFEQFHQVDSSNTKAKGGTGLGLAIAKQIVEMHGGRIWVESTLGKGSTFQMELPTRAELRKPAP